MSDVSRFDSTLLGEHYYRIVHDSGLRIFVFPKEMLSTYGIFTVNFGGSVVEYEKNGVEYTLPQGCAHFLEHKMFENEDGSNADDVFSSFGSYDNAYTSNERTAYLFSATDNVYECLEELLSFVTKPYFTKKTVKKEIGIIAEEIRGCVDDPYDRCYMNMLDSMYFNNPVKNEICGSEASISMITPDVLYQCCKDFYTPENMVLSICGKVRVEEVIGIVDRVIGCERIPFEINLKGYDEPKKVKCTYKEKRMHIGKPIFCIGIKDCDIPVDPIERYKKSEGMNILLHMMFSEAGEFYLDMLEKGMVSPGFDSGYSAGAKTAYVMISGESDCPEDLLERIKEHISTCREKGLSREDFERERKCLYSSFISDFDSTEDIAFAMTSYAFDGVDLFGYPEIVREISFEYITELLEKTFADNRFTLSVIKPLNEK